MWQVWGPKAVRLGFAGGALATSLSYTLNVSARALSICVAVADHQFVFCFTWAMLYGPKEARYSFQLSQVFSKLGTVTSLGLAGTIMVSLAKIRMGVALTRVVGLV